MLEQNGTIIVIEGSDGSGKSTQLRLLTERLRVVGYDVEVFKFPQYDQPSSHFVKSYLNGEYGPASNISPYAASMFYALDRFEAAPSIRKAASEGKIVLIDRYVGSNMAHQGSKFHDAVQQRGFFIWDDSLEFQLLNIPRPTLNLFLRVPAEISQKLMVSESRHKRNYTGLSHDEHEKDIKHLQNSVTAYDTLCQLFPKDFVAIECTKDGNLMSIPDINNLIWERLLPILPPRAFTSGQAKIVHLDQIDDRADLGPNRSRVAQNAKSQIAVEQGGKTKLEVSNISLLAASQLDGISPVKLEKIFLENDKDFVYYKLPRLTKELARQNKDTLEHLSKLRDEIKDKVYKNKRISSDQASSVVLSLTPMSALVNLRLSGFDSDIGQMLADLALKSDEETKWLYRQLKQTTHNQNPNYFKAAKNSEEKTENVSDDFTSLFINGSVTFREPDITTPVKIFSWPRNEFEILSDSVYSKSSLSRDEITAEIETWPYEQKLKALKSALGSTDNRILYQVRYRWDVIADQESMQPLLNSQIVEDLQTQSLDVRYGYELPDFLTDNRLDSLLVDYYELSSDLFKAFQTAGRDDIAGYAGLLGHKRRWLFSTTLRGLQTVLGDTNKLKTSPLLLLMGEQLSQVHPVTAEHILLKDSRERLAKSKPTR